jgi:3-(3-hydroxy-phenyl)propionate hydroxylase
MHSPIFGLYNRIDTTGAIDGHPKLVTFFQPELERKLRERVAQYPNVEVRLGWELKNFENTASNVRVEVVSPDGSVQALTAEYLVGADGATSTVRRLLGLDFQGETYPEDWLVVDVKNAPQPIDHVEFICTPERPAPHMPAPGNRQRWEFKLQAGETREDIEKPEVIKKLLDPWDPEQKSQIERVAVYRFHARVADTFNKGRTFLVGDAAHITPPFVGQGLVAGLRDVGNLAWKLAWVCKDLATEQLLKTYDKERHPHARDMIDVAKLMGKLVMPRNKPLAIFSHGLVVLLRLIPRVQRFIETAEIKPPHTFRRGAFVSGKAGRGLTRGGLFPQVWLRSGSHDGKVLLSDDVLEGKLALVGFGVDPQLGLARDLVQLWTERGGKFVTILPRGQFKEGAYEDMAGDLLGSKVALDHVAVVRPDNALLNDGPSVDVNDLVNKSLALLD